MTTGDEKLYWIEDYNNSCQRISSSNYNGSNIQTLIVTSNPGCLNTTIDFDENSIYPIYEQSICMPLDTSISYFNWKIIAVRLSIIPITVCVVGIAVLIYKRFRHSIPKEDLLIANMDI